MAKKDKEEKNGFFDSFKTGLNKEINEASETIEKKGPIKSLFNLVRKLFSAIGETLVSAIFYIRKAFVPIELMEPEKKPKDEDAQKEVEDDAPDKEEENTEQEQENEELNNDGIIIIDPEKLPNLDDCGFFIDEQGNASTEKIGVTIDLSYKNLHTSDIVDKIANIGISEELLEYRFTKDNNFIDFCRFDEKGKPIKESDFSEEEVRKINNVIFNNKFYSALLVASIRNQQEEISEFNTERGLASFNYSDIDFSINYNKDNGDLSLSYIVVEGNESKGKSIDLPSNILTSNKEKINFEAYSEIFEQCNNDISNKGIDIISISKAFEQTEEFRDKYFNQDKSKDKYEEKAGFDDSEKDLGKTDNSDTEAKSKEEQNQEKNMYDNINKNFSYKKFLEEKCPDEWNEVTQMLKNNDKRGLKKILKNDELKRSYKWTLAIKGYKLDVLACDKDERIRKAVPEGAKINNRTDILDKLISDESPFVRCEVAKQEYGLNILMHDESWMVKATVARHGTYGLDELMNDESEFVRKATVDGAVKTNNMDVLGVLINDENESVRSYAIKEAKEINFDFNKPEYFNSNYEEVRKIAEETKNPSFEDVAEQVAHGSEETYHTDEEYTHNNQTYEQQEENEVSNDENDEPEFDDEAR